MTNCCRIGKFVCAFLLGLIVVNFLVANKSFSLVFSIGLRCLRPYLINCVRFFCLLFLTRRMAKRSRPLDKHPDSTATTATQYLLLQGTTIATTMTATTMQLLWRTASLPPSPRCTTDWIADQPMSLPATVFLSTTRPAPQISYVVRCFARARPSISTQLWTRSS